MKSKRLLWLYFCFAVVLLVLNIWGIATFTQGGYAASGQTSRSSVLAAIAQRVQRTAPVSFLHRPYYGNRTILQRTTSYVDHDRPWYDFDGLFVRYDGMRWQNNQALTSCTPRVSCYDGHNGYDLDLSFEPVLSAAPGTVIRANWYNPMNHNSSLGLWVAIDHGNGFVTAYGHLSAITVARGDHVGTQWQIGTSGTTGSSTGPHLHMATYYLPYWQATDPFGWRGNYPDPNPVPDRYLWVDNPGTHTTVPYLSASRAPYPGALLVDDGGTGWSSTGGWQSDHARSDVNGNLHWTATSATGATASATWQPAIPSDGYYEVGVYVDDTHASSSWVPYTVYSADSSTVGAALRHSVYVDESHIGTFGGPFGTVVTGPQWVSIGTYYFRRGQNGRVVVSNATGEANAQIAADGVEFVRVADNSVAAGQQVNNIGGGPAPRPVPTPSPGSGASAAHGPASSHTVYFAEGYTGVGTTETLALTNGAAVQANVTITYLYQNAVLRTRSYQLSAGARRVLTINQEAGADQSVSMMVQSDQAFTAERTMAVHKGSFAATTESTGSSTLSTNWFFAEGNTTSGWNTLLAALNPTSSPVTLHITALPIRSSSGGSSAPKNMVYTLPAHARSTIVLNNVIANQRFAMAINASGAIALERAEYLVAGPQSGGSTTSGVNAPQKTWSFAVNNSGVSSRERLLLANPSAAATGAQIRYLLAGGRVVTQVVSLPGQSCVEVDVNGLVLQTRHATVINAGGPIVAEQQDFFTAGQGGGVSSFTLVMGNMGGP